MSKMTLAQLRNKIALSSYPEKYEWIDAIDAELKARGEPVAVADVERLGHGYPTTAYPLSHPNAASMGKLYTAPPAPKITDARIIEIAADVATRTVFANIESPQILDIVRAALEAALKETP